MPQYPVLHFATHGLVSDVQPKRSGLLLAPETGEDGLLQMSEIYGLGLKANLVVLSACQTALGREITGEGLIGLSRAFFYAGTRALLVTNWSVHSQSARELVSDMFERQAGDPSLSRAEALRQAMVKLIDGKGYTDEQGKTQFAYAHPLFWAPYTIIGDGGRR